MSTLHNYNVEAKRPWITHDNSIYHKREQGQLIANWTLFAIFPALSALYLIWTLLHVPPALTNITTQDTLPYIPAKAEIVENVINVMVQGSGLTGGAGGVGSPQVERSLEAYIQNESNSTHFLLIKVGRAIRQTEVHYFDFQPGVAFHTTYTYTSPETQFHGWVVGYYIPTRARLENGRLAVDRIWWNNDSFIVSAFAIFSGALILYYIAAAILNQTLIIQLIKRLYPFKTT